jgi:hypothetical protein
MKTKIILFGFVLAASLSAADTSAILLRGKSVSVEEGRVSGSASAIVGDMSVSAEIITFDMKKNILKCDGAVSIRVAGSVVTAKDCVIELVAGHKRVYFVNPEEIKIGPNQAPTSTAVTPPASAGDRASGTRGSP